MGKYGNGVSFVNACKMDREQIKHALKGELMYDEDEDRFFYEKASKEECEKFILDCFDEAVHQAIEAMRCGNAYEEYLKERSLTISLPEFIKARDKAIAKEKDKYIF